MVDVAAWFETGIGAAILLLEAAAAIVILVAAGRAFVSFLAHTMTRGSHAGERRTFARSLVLALDFTIGSDVLKLAIRPTLDAALVVGLVVLVRSLLTFVLEYELRRANDRSEA